jgi:magnesium chelatase subunit I
MGDRGTGKSTTVRALVDLYLQWMWLQMILSTHTIRSWINEWRSSKKFQAGETLETATKRITMIDLPLEQQKIVLCTIDIEKN